MPDPLVRALRLLGLARLAVRRWFVRTFIDGAWYGILVIGFAPGCAALQAALPGIFGAAETVAVNMSEAEKAKVEAAKCEAGRKQTAKKLDAIEREIREVRGYVETHDAGAPVGHLDCSRPQAKCTPIVSGNRPASPDSSDAGAEGGS